MFNCSPKCTNSTLSSDVGIDASAILVPDIERSGREQIVKISTSSQGGKVSGHLSGGGPSGSDALAAQVNQQIINSICVPALFREIYYCWAILQKTVSNTVSNKVAVKHGPGRAISPAYDKKQHETKVPAALGRYWNKPATAGI